jgi:hypothetical protein
MAMNLIKFKKELASFKNRDSHESDDTILGLLAPAIELLYCIYKFLDGEPGHPMTSLFKVLDTNRSSILTPPAINRIRILKQLGLLVQKVHDIFPFSRTNEILHCIAYFDQLEDPEVDHDVWPTSWMLQLKIDAWKSKLKNAIKLLREWSNYHIVTVVYSEVECAHDIIKDLIILMQQLSTTDRRTYFSMKHKLHAIKVTLRAHPIPEWAHHFHRIDALAIRSRSFPTTLINISQTREFVLWTLIAGHGHEAAPSELSGRLPQDMVHRASYVQDPSHTDSDSESE